MADENSLKRHHTPKGFSDQLALAFTKSARFFADFFFARRYAHRAVVLETVAAVPGMVGGALQHLRSLRRMESDKGWIHTLLDEAENERMHLMTFINIAKPTRFERLIILLAQGVFFNGFFLLYLLSILNFLPVKCEINSSASQEIYFSEPNWYRIFRNC